MNQFTKFSSFLSYKIENISLKNPDSGAIIICLGKRIAALLKFVMLGQSYPFHLVLMYCCNCTKQFAHQTLLSIVKDQTLDNFTTLLPVILLSSNQHVSVIKFE